MTFKRLAQNASITTAAAFWRIALSIVLTPFLIHTLGTQVYGVWVLVLSFSVTGYMSLFSLGIEGALVKWVAEFHARGEGERLNRVFTAAFVAFGAVGFFGAMLLVLFTRFLVGRVFHIPPELLPLAQMVMVLLAIQTVFEFPSMAFTGLIQGLQRYDIAAVFDVVRSTTFALLAVAALRSGASLVALAVIAVSLAVANVVSLAVTVTRLLPSLRLTREVGGPDILSMAHLSGQIFVLRINTLVYWQMDKAILGIFLATSVLTHYDIAARFHSLVTMVMGLLSSVLLSSAAALYADRNMVKLQELFLLATKYSAGLSLPITIAIMVLARPLLQAWVGPEFAGDASIVQLFLAYTLFWVLVQVGWNMMIAANQTSQIVKIQVATTVINLAVSVVVTPRFGIRGVLIGTLVGNTAAFLCYMPLFLRVLELPTRTFLREVVARAYPPAILGGAVLISSVKIHPPIGLLAVVAYAVGSVFLSSTVFWFAGLDSRERQRFFSLLRGAKASEQVPFVETETPR